MNPKILEIAIAKCKPYSHSGLWSGYLTPSEVLTLVEAGIEPESESWLDYMKHKHKLGRSNRSWFYFRPTKVVMNKSIKKNTYIETV